MALEPPRVLVVDDDRKLSGLLVEFLRSHGLDAAAAHDGPQGLRRAAEERWDLVVLDVMLPELDGFELLRKLRAGSRVPVLMLTARGGEDDRVFGLDQGADDYLPKTASSRELLARIRALLRRAAAPQPPVAEQTLSVGELRIDAAARAARIRGAPLSLTPVEFDLLLDLARHRGQVRSREALLDGIRDREFEASDRSIDVHVAALRRKLGDDPRAPALIRTVRTVGYLLIDPDAP